MAVPARVLPSSQPPWFPPPIDGAQGDEPPPEEIARRLFDGVARGLGVDELCAQLAGEAMARVAVFDERLTVIGASPALGSLAHLHAALISELAPTPGQPGWLEESGAWATVYDDGAGAAVGLLIWPREPDVARAGQIIALAVPAFAIVVRNRELLASATSGRMEDIVAELLVRTGGDLQQTAERARRFGIDPDRPLAVLVADGSRVPVRTRRSLRVSLVERGGLVGFSGPWLVLIAPAQRGSEAARALQRLLSTGGHTPPTVVIVNAREGAAGVATAHRRGQRALQLANGLGRAGDIVDEASLVPYAAILGERSADEIAEFITETIAPLREHDQLRHSEFALTLLTFLDHGHGTTPTSIALNVHPNTLRHRLERIDELLPQWRDPRRCLEVHLALRLDALRADPADWRKAPPRRAGLDIAT
jgi:hypothetical protein